MTMTIANTEATTILETLEQHRFFLRFTVRDLTDEQAGESPTASVLCLGGLIKHVTSMERAWVNFIVHGSEAVANVIEGRDDEFRMLPTDTLVAVLEDYDQVARRTEEVVRSLPDLDVSHPLPPAPWFKEGASWSARQVLLHILAETSQHAGHADIIRETIDGAKTMG